MAYSFRNRHQTMSRGQTSNPKVGGRWKKASDIILEDCSVRLVPLLSEKARASLVRFAWWIRRQGSHRKIQLRRTWAHPNAHHSHHYDVDASGVVAASRMTRVEALQTRGSYVGRRFFFNGIVETGRREATCTPLLSSSLFPFMSSTSLPHPMPHSFCINDVVWPEPLTTRGGES